MTNPLGPAWLSNHPLRVTDRDDRAFDRWLREIDPGPTLVSDEPGDISPGWRQWLHQLFEREGAVSREVMRSAATAYQLTVAREATAAVVADLHRTTSLRPDVVVDVLFEHAIRISINGGYTTPSMDTMDRGAGFAEVADYFQGELAQASGMWPECPRHDAGAHPEVRDGSGVWWCRKGQHVIAPIGELTAAP